MPDVNATREFSLPTRLGLLLRDVGLTRERFAESIGISTHTLDSWWSGQATPNLANLGSAIKLLDGTIAAPERLRDLLLEGLIRLGLDEEVADAYLGLHRLPRLTSAYAIVLGHGGSNPELVAASGQMHSDLLRAGHEPVSIDCSALPTLRPTHLEEVVSTLAPAGLILCQSVRAADLDETARRIARFGIPTVYFGVGPRVLPRTASCIGFSYEELGYDAGAYVAKAGFDKVTIFSYAGSTSHSAGTRGFYRALAGLAPQVKISHTEVSSQDNYLYFNNSKVVLHIQRQLVQDSPQAVFVPSVPLALALVDAANGLGVDYLASLTAVTIGPDGRETTLLRSLLGESCYIVDQPIRALAKKAVEAVLRLSEG